MERWARWHPGAPPVGFLLRDAPGTHWLRIHSLPQSKRMPESDADYAELLRRHNLVASEVLGDRAACAALVLDRCDEQRPTRDPVPGLSIPPLPRVASLPPEWRDEERGFFDGPVCIYGVATRWVTGAFDDFIRAVADDATRGLLVELERGQVYAPYDGGADLFFATAEARDAARDRYAPWLPPEARGPSAGVANTGA